MIIHEQRSEIDTAITTKQPFLLLFDWIKLNAKVDKFNFVSYFFIRKSYPNRQSDADHGNWNGCQLITRKRGHFSNSLDFKRVYSLYRFIEIFCMADDFYKFFDAMMEKYTLKTFKQRN